MFKKGDIFEVSDIFYQKLNEIQSRVPIKIAGTHTRENTFQDVLNSAFK